MFYRIRVLAAMDGVRLDTQQSDGYLVIAEVEESDKKVNKLIWTKNSSKQLEAIADNWQSISIAEPINETEIKMKSLPIDEANNLLISIEENDLILLLENISSISTDETSKCLIVSTLHNSKYTFQFMNASPTQALSLISLAIEGNNRLSRDQGNKEEWDLDLGLKILNTFGQVKNFYTDTASDVVNNVLNFFTPTHIDQAEDQEGGLRNPWILDKRIELPNSRFTGKQLNDSFLVSFLRSDGSIPNLETLIKVVHFTGLDSSIRRSLWIGIFQN
jgi:hypothetical protein